MKATIQNWRHVLAGTIIGLATMTVLSTSVWANGGNPNPQVMPPHAHPFGKSYGEWSAEWWKWHFEHPATGHPALSTDGANCDSGQSGKVWFLTGTFVNEVPENEFFTVVRDSCSVPTGKAIFFPIVNVECSNIEEPPFFGETPSELLTCASSHVDGPNAIVTDLSVIIDGNWLEDLENYRFQSPAFRFHYGDPNDNIGGVDCSVKDCDNAVSVSDGYWIMLPPLSRGRHSVQFIGSFRDPITGDLFFGLDVTYELKVVGGRRHRH